MANRLKIKRYLIENPLNIKATNLLTDVANSKNGFAFNMYTVPLQQENESAVYARKVECRTFVRYSILKRRYYNSHLIEIPLEIDEKIFETKIKYTKDRGKFAIRKKRYAFYNSGMLCELDIYYDLHDKLKILNLFPKDSDIIVDKKDTPPFFRIKKELKNEEFSLTYLINNNFNQFDNDMIDR